MYQEEVFNQERETAKYSRVLNTSMLHILMQQTAASAAYISLYLNGSEYILDAVGGLSGASITIENSISFNLLHKLSPETIQIVTSINSEIESIAGFEIIDIKKLATYPIFSPNENLLGSITILNWDASLELDLQANFFKHAALIVAANVQQAQQCESYHNKQKNYFDLINYSTPYFIILNRKFELLEWGRNYSKLSLPLKVGTLFSDFFSWAGNFDLDTLYNTDQYSKKLLFFISNDNKLKFKCAIRILSSNEFIIMAMPVINQAYPIQNYNVSLNDFASHDYVSEFIFLNESFTRGLQDSLELNAKLKSKNRELERSKELLIDTNQILEEKVNERTREIKNLALFPEQNPNPVLELNFEFKKISYMNPSAIKIFGGIETYDFDTILDKLCIDTESLNLKKNQKQEILVLDKVFEKNIFFIEGSAIVRMYLHDITRIREKEKLEREKNTKFLNQQKALLEMRCLPNEMGTEEKILFILKKTSEILHTSRSSVWLFNDSKEVLKLHLEFPKQEYVASESQVIYRSDYPNYFQSICTENILQVDFASNHPISKEFKSFDHDKSMLDVSLLQANNSIGVLCNEYSQTTYNEEEISFARSVADVIILVIENNELKEFQKELLSKNTQLQEAFSKLVAMQEDVIQQEKMATLGMLIAGIAHEINTPLGAIKASNENIIKSLTTIFSPRINNFSKEFIRDTFDFLSMCNLESIYRSTREERQIIKNLEIELVANFPQLIKVNYFARRLAELGFLNLDANLHKFISSPENFILFEFVSELHLILRSSKTISIAADKATKVVKALNTFSHGNIENEWSSFNLLENIESVVILFQNKIKHHVSLKINIDSNILISGNQEQLAQVWSNIINNAIQASDSHCSIWIDYQSVNNTDVISIANDGPMIPKEALPKIFDAFYSTKKRGQGTGLGLNIVKKIIEGHKGKIDCTSEEGKTVFIITLPK